MPFTVSGSAGSLRRSAQRASARAARQSGFPPARERSAAAGPRGKHGAPQRSTSIAARSRRPRAAPAAVSPSSPCRLPSRAGGRVAGLAVQTQSSGTSDAQSTRWSTKSSRSSSAQWSPRRRARWGAGRRAPRGTAARRRSPPLGHGWRRLPPPRPTSGRRWRSTQRASASLGDAPRRRLRAASRLRVGGRVGLENARLGLDHLGKRPERHALAVRQRPSLPPGDQLGVRVDDPRSSKTSRLLPIPGTPTSVTSWHVFSARALARASTRRSSSRSPPTSGAPALHASTPKRDRASTASQTSTGLALPFATTGSRSRGSRSRDRSPGRSTASTRTRSSCAAACSREAVFTTSPDAIPSPGSGGAERDERLAGRDPDPDLDVLLVARPLADRQRRTHRPLGIVLVADGAPNRAITASPTNFSTVPPCARARADPLVIAGQKRANILGIHRLGAPREADEVAEEYRHDLALLARARFDGERRPAARTAGNPRESPGHRRSRRPHAVAASEPQPSRS